MRGSKAVQVIGGALLSLTTAMAAQADTGYVAVMGSFVKPDKERDLDNGPGAAFVIGNRLMDGINWELNVFAHRNDVDFPGANGSVRSFGMSVDINSLALWRPGQPFFLFGLGFQNEKFEGLEETSPMISTGVGAVFPEWGASGTSLRAELRGNTLFNDDLTGGDTERAFDVRLNVGVQFGGDGQPAAPALAPIQTLTDSDGDGIPDGVDGCPATASGTTVDGAGCPLDSDGDGVVNSADRCPGTPVGQKVDATGCTKVSKDSDRDGVPDEADQCAGTAAGRQVDERGCVVVEKIVLAGVSFATGSATLTAGAKKELAEVAASLKAKTDTRVEIGGHSDSVGADDKNLALSQKRADSVKAYLVSQGVAADRLTAKGYGETQPIDSNDTAEGRARNRRVEFKALD